MNLEKDGVTITGFVIIFILILLIILPPVLRLMFGTKDQNNSKSMMADVYENLSCEKKENTTSYLLTTNISTLYKNNEATKLTFKYKIIPSTTNAITTGINIPEYEILKQIPKAKVVEGNNEYSVIIEYDKSNKTMGELLSKYVKSSNEQKTYYTKEGYICNIIK